MYTRVAKPISIKRHKPIEAKRKRTSIHIPKKRPRPPKISSIPTPFLNLLKPYRLNSATIYDDVKAIMPYQINVKEVKQTKISVTDIDFL